MAFDEEYFNSEEFQEVLESYEAAEAAGETPMMDADDLVDLADYYTWQGDEERATDIIEQGLQFYPDHALLNVFMARRALMDNDFDEAQHYADNITDTDAHLDNGSVVQITDMLHHTAWHKGHNDVHSPPLRQV